ncbi:hypothetical protein [Vibrio sp. SCSIO 43136]|uniref:hypothetical protein n=1 Tax=Vibrio sp. SCSIO 43136 TaxID=2819101 RepID=UPI0020758B1C|nr:hypothetical protein [Vibrio sp. SCSIO 43136]USD64198.1 hypothetical protein J4N39_08750 [Vibrio sp. SCSIO 43136]
MIETAIYWSGVFTIFAVLLAISVFALFSAVVIGKDLIIRELSSLYNHARLCHLMKRMKKLGIDGALKEQQKLHQQD